MKPSSLLAAWLVAVSLSAAHAASISVSHKEPCNLYPLEEPVSFQVDLAGLPITSPLKVDSTITNYFGETVWTNSQPVTGANAALTLSPGKMEPGYYELKITATDGKAFSVSNPLTSFGVAQFYNRSAKEAREQGSRYGIKTFQLGDPGVWWRKGEDWKLAEAVDACCKLGLQWTRHQFNQGPNPSQPGVISTEELAKYPMNIVMKIEGFPESCYDAERYGPLEDWVAKKKPWMRNTVPKKEPYQQWLREQLATVPANQNVFEIGNECWDKLSGKEFAEWVQLVIPVVKEVRPDSIIGIDLGAGDWEEEVVASGGLTGVDFLVTHPYAFSVLPERKTRISFRNDNDWLMEKSGRKFDWYVTEYGWSTAPDDTKYKHSVSERVQAQRTARQSLMLYAEDVRAMMVHWMADREQDPKDRENWFGVFRLTEQPKPVIMALAASERIIDGGKFVGDLWYGPGVGAMLFEKDGLYTLCVWNLDEEAGKGKTLKVKTGADKVTLVDIMGRSRETASPKGELTIPLSGDVTYIRGIGPSVVAQAAKPDQNLNPDVWGNRQSPSVTAFKVAQPPKIDGSLNDWSMKAQPIPLINEKVPAEDASAQFWISWDENFFYVAAKVKDEAFFYEQLTNEKGKTSDNADVLQVSIGARPDRQPDLSTSLNYDYNIRFSPTWGDGSLHFAFENQISEPIVNPMPGDPSGITWAIAQTDDGWTAEAAIPVKLMKTLTQLKAGDKFSVAATLFDVDKAKEKPSRVSFGTDKAQDWPYLILQ